MRIPSGQLGAALVDARTRRGLTRKDVERLTDGRLTASAIGGYERGERSISMERFVDLSYSIGVAPEELLADALHGKTPTERHQLTIDLTRLEIAAQPVREPVAEFVHTIQMRRRDYLAHVVTLRGGDVTAIAQRMGVERRTLVRELAPAVVPDLIDKPR
ncbi:MAG TPA: helix-turn-helix domain-containing protein [Actinomycetota bacterium]